MVVVQILQIYPSAGRVCGTNPFGFGNANRPKEKYVNVDFSTSMLAEGKV